MVEPFYVRFSLVPIIGKSVATPRSLQPPIWEGHGRYLFSGLFNLCLVLTTIYWSAKTQMGFLTAQSALSCTLVCCYYFLWFTPIFRSGRS